MWEADRPLTHTGPVAPLPAKAMHLAEDRTASPAVRERPISLPHGLSLSESPRWEAKHGLSLESHVICEAVLGLPRPHRFERPKVGGRRAQSDSTGQSNAFSCEISQASPRIVLPRPVCVRGRSEAVGGRVRERPCSPLIGSDRSHDKLWEAEGMGGRVRPNLGGRGRPCSSDWLRDISQPIRGARPPTASQIRPHTASHPFGLPQFH